MMPEQGRIRLVMKFFHPERQLEGVFWAGELPDIY